MAQGLPTSSFVELCSDPTSDKWRSVGQWLCTSFVRGVIDGARLQALHIAGSVEGHTKLMQFCVPETVTADEAIGAVLQHLERAPELRGAPAAATIFSALAARWPCRRQ